VIITRGYPETGDYHSRVKFGKDFKIIYINRFHASYPFNLQNILKDKDIATTPTVASQESKGRRPHSLLLPGCGYAALMENPSGLPQGLDNASRCPHTHEPLLQQRFFSF
jgi:hypothetical protein